jgi:F0F1-type ATP synthase membrane subunit a
MQETGVGWDPAYEGHLSWFTKMFALYLALALLVSAFRAISLMRQLWLPEKTQREPSERFRLTHELCQAKTASIKKLSTLTLLLSLLVLAWSITNILQGAALQKVTGTAFLAGALAETLTTFSLGLLVCTMLYALAIFYEGVLARRKMDFGDSKSKSQFPTE